MLGFGRKSVARRVGFPFLQTKTSWRGDGGVPCFSNNLCSMLGYGRSPSKVCTLLYIRYLGQMVRKKATSGKHFTRKVLEKFSYNAHCVCRQVYLSGLLQNDDAFSHQNVLYTCTADTTQYGRVVWRSAAKLGIQTMACGTLKGTGLLQRNT